MEKEKVEEDKERMGEGIRDKKALSEHCHSGTYVTPGFFHLVESAHTVERV